MENSVKCFDPVRVRKLCSNVETLNVGNVDGKYLFCTIVPPKNGCIMTHSGRGLNIVGFETIDTCKVMDELTNIVVAHIRKALKHPVVPENVTLVVIIENNMYTEVTFIEKAIKKEFGGHHIHFVRDHPGYIGVTGTNRTRGDSIKVMNEIFDSNGKIKIVDDLVNSAPEIVPDEWLSTIYSKERFLIDLEANLCSCAVYRLSSVDGNPLLKYIHMIEEGRNVFGFNMLFGLLQAEKFLNGGSDV